MGLSEDTCAKSVSERSKMTVIKSGSRTEVEGELNREIGLEISLAGMRRKVLWFARIEKKTSALRPALKSNQSSWCGLHNSRYGGGKDQMATSSA